MQCKHNWFVRGRQMGRGFTLLELLVVMTIIGILMALSLSSFQNMTATMAPRQAATEFMSAIRSARQFAMNNSVRTRIVFANDAMVEAYPDAKLEPRLSYSTYYFYKPTLPLGATKLSVVDNPTNSSGAYIVATNQVYVMEMQLPIISIPAGFVGQWVASDSGVNSWRTLPRNIDFQSDIFVTASDEQWASNNYFNPPSYWDPYVTNFSSTGRVSSEFPQNFHMVAYQLPYTLIRTNGVAGQPSWPTNYTYQYFSGADDFVGDPSDTNNFFYLRGIEFDSRGIPVFTTNVVNGSYISFTFTQKNGDTPVPNNSFEVRIDRSTGLPRLME